MSYLPNLTEREQFVVGERLKGLLLREIAEKMSVTGESKANRSQS